MKTAISLATLLFTLTLTADEPHVVPFAPTTATPIEVHYRSSCYARAHSVVREGREIVITALDPQCPAVAFAIVEKVKLPEVLPIGVYNVTIQQEHQPFFLAGTELVVRNAGPKPFELHPSAMEPFDEVPVRLSGVTCGQPDCSDITVRVDGEPVAITVADDGAIWFTTPEHESGLVDVTVQKSDSVTTSPGALYFYYDYYSSRRRDLSAYEPILFPVLFSANGAYGSRWSAEATVSNPAPWAVDADYTLNGIGPCIQDCDPPFEPKSFEKFWHGYPRGTVMWAPRSEASQLALALRIRDLSRQADGYGTEIPVVRERDFIHGSNIHLLDVPRDPRYRVKVRIYMVEPVLAPSTGGTVRILRDNRVLLEQPFTLTRRQVFAIEPYYAEVDLPQGVAGERVNVEIEMPLDAIGWAFAAVTNNETQQVTIVTPNGRGGGPR